MSAINDHIKSIPAHFSAGRTGEVHTLSGGLINHTYLVKDGAGNDAFILQRVNTRIFPRPDFLQENYVYIATTLQNAKSPFHLPELVRTTGGGLYWQSPDGESWRMFRYIANSYTPQAVEQPEQAHEVARSFSRLTLNLAHADPAHLHPVIPGFHDLTLRYEQLQQAIRNNASGRLKAATTILNGLEAYKSLLSFYQQITASGNFRKYILHHDTKISNILFDKTSKQVITPVDMDTTMPGYFFSDYGDMLRSMAGNLPESSTDFDDIAISPQYYEAIRSGYLDNMSATLTSEENRYFELSGLMVTFMQCMRFIADYLNGDVYYTTNYPNQNHDRAMNQLKLLQQMGAFVKEQYGLRW